MACNTPETIWENRCVSYQCAIEAVRRPDVSSAPDGRPNFASEAYGPSVKTTSLSAHSFPLPPNALRNQTRSFVIATIIIR